MEQQQQQPLLSTSEGRRRGEDEADWGYDQQRYVGLGIGRSASMRLPPPDVSLDDIRSATSLGNDSCSSCLYPPVVVDPREPNQHPYANEHPIVPHGSHGGLGSRDISTNRRQMLDEVEIRQLLLEHVGHHCCWASNPARTWKIIAIEDCNVYVGTLETFIEERESIEETKPYHGGKFDGKDNGPQLGVWELDLASEFPLLFVPFKETKTQVPHSENVVKCSDCEGRGEIACPTCNAGQKPGFYKPNQMSQCSACYGRGLIAHKDGSDTLCMICNGKGMLPCVACGSRGLVECHTCQGQGSLLTRNIGVVRWRTLSTRKVAAASGAASVPEEVFHSAKGAELCNIQAYQCTPAYFADSFLLNKFSSDIIASRSQIPSSARLICERHAISVVPVTRVIMAHHKQSFSFYIIGLGREVYIKNYPGKFCWGLCCCMEWLWA